MTDLDESVDSEDDEFWLRLGVIHEVKIHEFLLLEILRLLLRPFSHQCEALCHRSCDSEFTMFLTTSGKRPLQSFPMV